MSYGYDNIWQPAVYGREPQSVVVDICFGAYPSHRLFYCWVYLRADGGTDIESIDELVDHDGDTWVRVDPCVLPHDIIETIIETAERYRS